ncbi:MAG: hypothetical protein ACLTQN_07755 [Blautia massiliensis (ex Durand et al. 2017)]
MRISFKVMKYVIRMKATADKAIECMDNIKELNELEEQLKAEEQESEDED